VKDKSTNHNRILVEQIDLGEFNLDNGSIRDRVDFLSANGLSPKMNIDMESRFPADPHSTVGVSSAPVYLSITVDPVVDNFDETMTLYNMKFCSK